jgi:hypothetical protein
MIQMGLRINKMLNKNFLYKQVPGFKQKEEAHSRQTEQGRDRSLSKRSSFLEGAWKVRQPTITFMIHNQAMRRIARGRASSYNKS